MRTALALVALVLMGAVVVGCGNDGVPKDNSNVKGPPAPPPPGGPAAR